MGFGDGGSGDASSIYAADLDLLLGSENVSAIYNKGKDGGKPLTGVPGGIGESKV